jgi:hypothetical protein
VIYFTIFQLFNKELIMNSTYKYKLKTTTHAIVILSVLTVLSLSTFSMEREQPQICPMTMESKIFLRDLVDKLQTEVKEGREISSIDGKSREELIEILKNIGLSIPTGDMNDKTYQQKRIISNLLINQLLHTLGYNPFEKLPPEALMKIQQYTGSNSAQVPLVNKEFSDVALGDQARLAGSLINENLWNLLVLFIILENQNEICLKLNGTPISLLRDINTFLKIKVDNEYEIVLDGSKLPGINSNVFQLLADKLPQLEAIDITNCLDVVDLSPLKSFPKLANLHIEHVSLNEFSEETFFLPLKDCEKLFALTLHNFTGISKLTFPMLGLPNLKVLLISNFQDLKDILNGLLLSTAHISHKPKLRI